MIIYSIYKAVNSINGKVYIGFDSNWPARKCTHRYNSRSKNCPSWCFYAAIKKYGWENFEWYVVYQSLDKEHCKNEMEKHFINEYKSFIGFADCRGYNMTLGGEGTFGKKQTESNKSLMSIIIKERNQNSKWYNNGKENRFTTGTLGKEWTLGRLYQKSSTKNAKWYNNGTTHKVSRVHPGEKWIEGILPKPIVSEETRIKMSIARKGKETARKGRHLNSINE